MSKQTGSIIDVTVKEYLAAVSPRLSPSSLKIVGGALKDLLSFLAGRPRERLADVTAADLEAWRLALVERRFAPSSLEIYLRTVRQFFRWLEETQRLFVNPAAGLVIPKPPRRLMPVPSEAEVRRLLAQPDIGTALGQRDRALLETAYSTGARREELARLSIFDVNLEAKTIRVLGKGSKERVLPLGRAAAMWLGKYLRGARVRLLRGDLDQAALWVDRDGGKLEYAAMQQLVRHHADAAKVRTRISMHSLRRACATHMLRRGAHPLQLQMLLGHATTKTLSQYLRATITELRKTHARSKVGK